LLIDREMPVTEPDKPDRLVPEIPEKEPEIENAAKPVSSWTEIPIRSELTLETETALGSIPSKVLRIASEMVTLLMVISP
jgi:hypothetical protein